MAVSTFADGGLFSRTTQVGCAPTTLLLFYFLLQTSFGKVAHLPLVINTHCWNGCTLYMSNGRPCTTVLVSKNSQLAFFFQLPDNVNPSADFYPALHERCEITQCFVFVGKMLKGFEIASTSFCRTKCVVPVILGQYINLSTFICISC